MNFYNRTLWLHEYCAKSHNSIDEAYRKPIKPKVFKYEAVNAPWGRSPSSDGLSAGPSD
jgi:hypothetical protein